MESAPGPSSGGEAWSGSPRKKPKLEICRSGYVFNVTDRQLSSNGTPMIYFNLETEDGIKKGVCYDMNLEKSLLSISEKRSPVKLRRVIDYGEPANPKLASIGINERSIIQNLEKSEINFEASELVKTSPSKKKNEKSEPIKYRIDSLSEVRKLSKGDVIEEVFGIVHLAGAEQKIQTTAWEKKEVLMIENVVIADSTSTIRATFWGEEFAKQLKEGVKYKFTEMKVDIWKKKYKLVGSKKTSLTIVNDDANDIATEEAKSIISEKEVERVLQVSNWEKYYSCPGCKTKYSELSTVELVECACGAMTLLEDCVRKCNLKLKFAGESKWFTAFQDVLGGVLNVSFDELWAMRKEEIAVRILRLKNLRVVLDEEFSVVEVLQLMGADSGSLTSVNMNEVKDDEVNVILQSDGQKKPGEPEHATVADEGKTKQD